jgi:Ca-activated chloride channel family protein
MYSLAIILLIFALARPQLGTERVVIRAKGIDIIIAIDLSGSMQAIDIPKNINDEKELYAAIRSGKIQNRLESAKREIKHFIECRPNDRIGLIGFAEMAYNICPPTLDHAWLIANMNRLQPGIIGDRTGIASPIASAVHRLEKSDSKRRVMVLFTDGSNNIEDRISPRQAAKFAQTGNVVIYTVGIGSDDACVPQQTMGGVMLAPIKGEFDEKLLKDIAQFSEGKYYRAADADGLEKVMSEINKIEKTIIEQPKYIDYREFAPDVMLIAIIMTLLAFALEHTLWIKAP